MPSPGGLDSLGSPQTTNSVYYDRMSFGSAASRGPNQGSGNIVAQLEREKEELKRDYEYQIATLTAKLTGLLSGHTEHAESIEREAEKREEAEEEIGRLRVELDGVREDLEGVRREMDGVEGELEREREKARQAERELEELRLEASKRDISQVSAPIFNLRDA